MTLQIDFWNKDNHKIRRTSIAEFTPPSNINVNMGENNKPIFLSHDNTNLNFLDLLSENEEICRIIANGTVIWMSECYMEFCF